MTKTMKTDNELIAEFMGLVPEYWRLTPLHKRRLYWCIGKGGFGMTASELKYNTSWDWLMPVVEKINNTKHPTLNERIDVIIYRRTCHINDIQQIIIETTGKDMLECTYKAVVSFIKWYNQQNP